MADIAPLTPLRYALDKLKGGLGRVVAPPYDVISPEQRAALASQDPHNIVHLILPEGEGDAKYARAAELLEDWRGHGVLVRDEQPAFYRVEQTFAPPARAAGGTSAPSVTRRGFLALVKLVPFAQRVVLPHERTLSGPKLDRLKLFRATRANLSPGFMLYRDPQGALDAPLAHGEPLAEFDALDRVHHVVTKVTDPDAIRAVVEGIAGSTLLIADGHHRYETALAYAQEVTVPVGSGLRAEHRFFMTFLVNGDDPSLVVFPTHRHVHSLPGFSFEQLLRGARASGFRVDELGKGAAAEAIAASLATAGREGPSLAACAPDGAAAILTLPRATSLEAHPTLASQPEVLCRADVTVLHAGILEHLLGITPEAQAAKTNLWYPQDAHTALTELRGGKGDVLFLMNPTPVADVRAVAEAGQVMPQKSTFFYPKVPTGIAVHTLDPTRRV